jgi:hypothetical protein
MSSCVCPLQEAVGLVTQLLAGTNTGLGATVSDWDLGPSAW